MTIFVLNGFNPKRKTWLEIVGNWTECGLLKKFGQDRYYITRAAFSLLGKNGSYNRLAELQCELNTPALSYEVMA